MSGLRCEWNTLCQRNPHSIFLKLHAIGPLAQGQAAQAADPVLAVGGVVEAEAGAFGRDQQKRAGIIGSEYGGAIRRLPAAFPQSADVQKYSGRIQDLGMRLPALEAAHENNIKIH